MSYANRYLSTFLLCVVLIAPQLASAEDWANWRGPEQWNLARNWGDRQLVIQRWKERALAVKNWRSSDSDHHE